jgi:hypothetical protein
MDISGTIEVIDFDFATSWTEVAHMTSSGPTMYLTLDFQCLYSVVLEDRLTADRIQTQCRNLISF